MATHFATVIMKCAYMLAQLLTNSDIMFTCIEMQFVLVNQSMYIFEPPSYLSHVVL